MRYNPAFPRTHYDRLADNEWTRLTRNRRGELNFLVHMDVLQRHITADMDVLEVGAGAGIYTKELVHMVRRLVVSDLSEVQLAVNQDHMRDHSGLISNCLASSITCITSGFTGNSPIVEVVGRPEASR